LSPYVGSDLPNVSSALGLGHRKTVKPEIYLPGGKEPVSFRAQGDDILEIISRRQTGRQFGLKAATADPAGGLERETLAAGTSAATALATRAAHRIFDALMDEEGGSNHVDMDPEFYAVVTKALLIHSANWGEKGKVLEDLFGPHGQGKYVARRDNVARFLGYGKPIIEHAMQCASNRATMVGYGEITTEGAHLYRIPLPRSLEMVTELRSVNLTLAWFSPVNARHQAYRCAKLESGPITKMIEAFGVTRSRDQPSDKSTPRGSIFHSIFRGSRAVHFIDDGHLLLRVWCTEQAGQIDEPIRYGMAVTIEAGEGIPVYEEIRAQLAVPVVVQQSA